MGTFPFLTMLALGQGYLLAFFLLTSRFYRNAANTWLAVFGALLSTMIILDIFGEFNRSATLLIEFLVNDMPLEMLAYVPLYIYFKISSTSAPRFWKEWPLLIGPFLIDTLINLYLVLTVPLKAFGENQNIQFFYDLESIAAALVSVGLCYFSFRLIATSTPIEKRKWLKSVWRSSTVLLCGFILTTLLLAFADTQLSNLILAFYILISLWLFWLIYNGIVNVNLIDDRIAIQLKRNQSVSEKPVSATVDPPAAEPELHSSSKPKAETFDQHFQIIQSVVTNDHLYRDEDLGIEDLSKQVGLSVSYVSQIINQATNMNFPSWINLFRVREVKTMLTNPEFENYTVLAIGLEAGFKSKSAFYAAFKRETGVTPTEFRKSKS